MKFKNIEKTGVESQEGSIVLSKEIIQTLDDRHEKEAFAARSKMEDLKKNLVVVENLAGKDLDEEDLSRLRNAVSGALVTLAHDLDKYNENVYISSERMSEIEAERETSWWMNSGKFLRRHLRKRHLRKGVLLNMVVNGLMRGVGQYKI